MILYPQQWRILMRFLFFATLGFVCLPLTFASAQGLPANPWLAESGQVNNKVADNSANVISSNIPSEVQFNPAEDMQKLQNMATEIKEKIEVNNNVAQVSQSGDSDVNTLDALNALNTLSKYMDKNNTQNSSSSNNNFSEFSNLKSQLNGIMNKKNSYSDSTNNFQSKEIQKITRQYNSYKSKMKSNLNNLKNQAKPLVNTMKQSINEAEKATGVSF